MNKIWLWVGGDFTEMKYGNRILKVNRLSGTLNLTNSPSKSLQLIDLENNLITDLEPRTDQFSFDLM